MCMKNMMFATGCRRTKTRRQINARPPGATGSNWQRAGQRNNSANEANEEIEEIEPVAGTPGRTGTNADHMRTK
jgi:hypothetical protein